MITNNKKVLASLTVGASLLGFLVNATPAGAVQSPAGCTADNSVVNVASDVATAVAGDTITYTVSAGNPVSTDGCDITGRTMTLTLPDGSVVPFGPFDYPNPTVVAFVGSAPYTADNADAVGGFWTASVSWNGTLKSSSDLPSTGSKNASVLQIQPLEVEKTATATYDQKWNWTIDKSVNDSSLLLQEGESFIVEYEVEVGATSLAENTMVSGSITITNPTGNPTATITNVTDLLSIGGSATVVCPEALPKSLAAGDSFVCTYSKSLGAANTDQTNTATVTTSGTVPGNTSNVATVDFTTPTNIIDECITVDDTNPLGPQGVVICSSTTDKTLEYSVIFGPVTNPDADVVVACDDNFDYPNTADFVTNDTAAIGDDDQNVHVNVNCFQGCTLTQGYWKTHNDSFKGGAPTDDEWVTLLGASAEESLFFNSSISWFDVFWTAPKGNAWYQLAHQYMAAALNISSGADPSAVSATMTSVEAFFNSAAYDTPAEFAAISKKSQIRKDVITWAGILGSYNEGTIGPGHCDEQNGI